MDLLLKELLKIFSDDLPASKKLVNNGMIALRGDLFSLQKLHKILFHTL